MVNKVLYGVEQFDPLAIMESSKLSNANLEMMPVKNEMVRWIQIAPSAVFHSRHHQTACVSVILSITDTSPIIASNVFYDHKSVVNAQI